MVGRYVLYIQYYPVPGVSSRQGQARGTRNLPRLKSTIWKLSYLLPDPLLTDLLMGYQYRSSAYIIYLLSPPTDIPSSASLTGTTSLLRVGKIKKIKEEFTSLTPANLADENASKRRGRR